MGLDGFGFHSLGELLQYIPPAITYPRISAI